MRHKLNKLLSLGLCFSMMASTLTYAAPVQRQITRIGTGSYETVSEQNEVLEDVELGDYELRDMEVATSSVGTRVAKTFLDYFPDPDFAQGIAYRLGKNKEDYVTINELCSITNLHLSGRNISDLTGIENLMCLQDLSLQGNEISKIPDSIVNLTNLQILWLYNNQISELPDSMIGLSNLQHLWLSNNQISEIPDSLADLTNLRALSLSDNQITEIPDSFANLINLQSLDLDNNQISEIPDSFADLPRLKGLQLAYNQISEIPDSLADLSSLQTLRLEYNQIGEIPDSLADLTNLQGLYLQGNDISKIPDSIANLTNLRALVLSNNQISEIPVSLADLTNLWCLTLDNNQISSEIPESILATSSTASNVYDASNQYAHLDPLLFTEPDSITYEQLTSQLILQTQRYNNGILLGEWSITSPNGEIVTISGGDGSEISPALFDQKGIYNVNFCWDSPDPFPQLLYYGVDSLNFNSNIKISIVPNNAHTVTLTTRYLDDALPESTQTYSVEDGTRFEQPFEVLDGYGLSGMELFTMPDFDVDMDTRTVFIDPVTQDYNIILEFEKLPVREHNVTVITRYLDDALPEHTETYTVPRGSAFLESFEILDGYELISTELRTMPEFDVDMDSKTVSLDPVNQDHTILLEFDKQINKVKLTTKYLDGHLPEASQVTRVRYSDPYSQTYEIATGYQIANINQLPAGVTVDEASQTVTISSVTEPYDILLEFEKKQFQVTITVIYEDGAYEDQITTHSVPYGDPLETSFIIDEDYIISKVSFNAIGVSVNKNQQTVKIRSVTSPIQITIRVK